MICTADNTRGHHFGRNNYQPGANHVPPAPAQRQPERFLLLMLVGGMFRGRRELLTKTTKVCVAGIEQSKPEYHLRR